MASELYIQVPATYGDFFCAGPGSPLLAVAKYGRDAGILLHLHLRMVLYSKKHRTGGVVSQEVVNYLSRPAAARTAKRDALRLAEAGFIEVTNDGYYVPAAEEWVQVRIGTRNPIPGFIRERVYRRDGYRCTECGSEETLTLDHVIPWSQYGPDDEGNLRTLCGPCNSRKGARA